LQQPIVYELLRRWLYGPQHSLYTNGVLAYTGSATGPIGDALPAMNDLRIATRQAGGRFGPAKSTKYEFGISPVLSPGSRATIADDFWEPNQAWPLTCDSI